LTKHIDTTQIVGHLIMFINHIFCGKFISWTRTTKYWSYV